VPESFFVGYEVHVSSTVNSGGFGADNLKDQNPKTPWSSVGHNSEDENEWFAFWFPRQSVNMLELTPRRISEEAYGFPKTIDISYSDGPNDWQHIRTVPLSNPEDGSSNVLVSLDKTVTTDGLLVRATKLGTDDFNNYYFQMAGARASYRTVTFDEGEAKNAAVLFPTSLFFFGDEPDLHLPADEYGVLINKRL